MENNISQLKPYQDRVLIKIFKKESIDFAEELNKALGCGKGESDEILILGGTDEDFFDNQGEVVAVSDSVTGIKVGDKVIFDGGSQLNFKGVEYLLSRESQILTTIL